ncbi:MAG TPA: dephospho-CoA kinase [Gemmataceae bacterium]|nr:dephospho-CoA kinase [Gemmataceae bacterium]
MHNPWQTQCPIPLIPVVGLIGGIGSGKSLIAELFRQRGAPVISGDELGHQALGQPEIRADVVRRWGHQVLEPDGTISRRRLAAIVFGDGKELRALEALVFPSIERGIRQAIAAARRRSEVRLIVLDAAVLLEAGWDRLCDWIVYVHAPRAVRLRRLKEQRGWAAKEVQKRERMQMSLTDKVSRAEYVVDNSGAPEHAARQVDDLLSQWGIAKISNRNGE